MTCLAGGGLAGIGSAMPKKASHTMADFIAFVLPFGMLRI